MRRRPTLPIVLATLVPVLLAVPGVYLGVRQLADALARPPAGGVVSLGMVLGFWLVVGSVFLASVSMLLGGLALDVRDMRNARCTPRDLQNAQCASDDVASAGER